MFKDYDSFTLSLTSIVGEVSKNSQFLLNNCSVMEWKCHSDVE